MISQNWFLLLKLLSPHERPGDIAIDKEIYSYKPGEILHNGLDLNRSTHVKGSEVEISLSSWIMWGYLL